VPDGSLCTASAEQILPRDSIQRNCFKLALHTTRDHDCISNRIGSGIRTCPRCGCRLACRLAKFGALPTPSMIDRAIIMLNNHRFWGYASSPSLSGKTLRRSIHCWHGHAARRSALPRERFSPLKAKPTSRLHIRTSQFDPKRHRGGCPKGQYCHPRRPKLG
jgi:hypothetical protein